MSVVSVKVASKVVAEQPGETKHHVVLVNAVLRYEGAKDVGGVSDANWLDLDRLLVTVQLNRAIAEIHPVAHDGEDIPDRHFDQLGILLLMGALERVDE